ncbi:serine/threonine protein kinase [Phytohabitans houttuyneae]|uniref:non-specific serine/threonine protein kinase n=1 Tax=Phytohabitans houttuyneae TaxID=1076126 RepID=A0A6V8KPS6_9ACTN|nr:serine/threonine-protein kinase [Phytohabitans houttuyneae]GFJ83846.1 serine/threonine-protein kinase PknA [Phytohabitans houttuyneae]
MRIDQVLGGRYRLLCHLGSGGMATVWRAHDEVLDRVVAVKVLAGPYSTDPGARSRIRAEARAAASLSHPHVTNVHDYGECVGEDGASLPYVVMELLPGQTLAQRLADGPIPPRAAMRLCSQIAEALAAAHARGLVHRDVKPSNVILTPAGAKVLDFGIAVAAGQEEPEADGRLLGTPAYIAPERITADLALPSSDVYALGVLIHRVLTNRLPWTVETTMEMLNAHIFAEPAPLPAIEGVPFEINEVTARCLARDPWDRPEAAVVAGIFATAAGLAVVADDDGDLAAAPAPPPQRPRPDDEPDAMPASPALPASPGRPGVARRVLLVGALVIALVTAAAAALRQADDRPSTAGGPLSTGQPAQDAAQTRATQTPQSLPAASSGSTVTPPSTRPNLGAAPDQKPSPSAASSDTGSPAASRTSVPPPGTTPGPAPGTTVTALGGVVRVQCAGRTAQVLDVQPAAGYTIKDYDAGPAAEVQVVLQSATNESEIKVRCGSNGPLPRIKESQQ